MIRHYQTAASFKEALEERLRTASISGVDFDRRRQLLVFDRFLARIASEFGNTATLKGGLAVELRIQRARTTKDVDLRVMGSPDNLLAKLRSAGSLDLGDYLVYTVRPEARHPDIQNDGMKYDGVRMRAECSLAGKIYGRAFGVDVAFGDPILGEPDLLLAADVLGFAGVAPPRIRVYPVETHIAEKLHAYTMPRPRPNSRVKDLPDLALIATVGPLQAARLREAVAQTFGFRATHNIPVQLPPPPESWAAPYAQMARGDRLPWTSLGDVFLAARTFLDPILDRTGDALWDPEAWNWAAFRP